VTSNKLLGIGIGGAFVAAICCFTPLLVVTLTSVGLAAWASSGWLDFILLGSLCFFLLIAGYAVIRRIRPANRAGNRSSDTT
jgi:mercuric ion transport protein